MQPLVQPCLGAGGRQGTEHVDVLKDMAITAAWAGFGFFQKVIVLSRESRERERSEQKPLTQRAPPREPCPLFTLEYCHMCYLRRIRNIWTCSGGGSCNFRSFAPLLIPHRVFILVPFSGE